MKQPGNRVIRVGIIGFGTVGTALAGIVASHAVEIERRCGLKLVIGAVCCRGAIPPERVPAGAMAGGDWRALAASPQLDVIVETVGGTGVAREIVAAALSAGKPVVTANKALIAACGDELYALAAACGVPLGIEAAVAGGVPVIRAISEGTAGDRLLSVHGILNGTANFILTQMEREAAEFEAALAEAQRLGYAELDPARDIDGLDARDKIAILARLAFGGSVAVQAIPTAGIRELRAIDLVYARQLRCSIRLVAAAEKVDGAISLSVRPWLVRRDSMLARVEGINNAVFLEGEQTGTQMFYGRGAGGGATAIAVLADLIEIANDLRAGTLAHKKMQGFAEDVPLPLCAVPPAVPWYLRLVINDRPGVLAQIATLLAQRSINIDFVLQQPGLDKHHLPFVITVEPVSEPEMRRAAADLDASHLLLAPVVLLRMATE